MANEIQNSALNLPAEMLEQMAVFGGFLPSVQVVNAMSRVRQNYDPKVNGPVKPEEGMFWFGTNKMLGVFEDGIGEFLAIPYGARPHALLLEGNQVTGESYDFASEEFSRIRNTKKGGGIIPRWGLDLLLWLPGLGKFGVYFFHSTARPVGAAIAPQAGHPVIIRSKLNRTSSFSWYSPQLVQVSSGQDEVTRPSDAILEDAKTKFTEKQARNTEPAVAPAGGKDR